MTQRHCVSNVPALCVCGTVALSNSNFASTFISIYFLCLFRCSFVINNNLSDSVSIRLGLSQSDPLVGKRTQLLESIGVFKENDLAVLPSPRFISPELLGFVRVFNMDEGQLTHWLAPDKCATDLLHLDCALNTEVETKTWIFMKTRITLLLKSFATSIEDDEHLLEMHAKKGQQKLGHIKLLIVQFRLNEKRILRDALTYVGERIKP